MEQKFLELFDEKIGQLTFLDREKVISLMEITYQMGKDENKQKYDQLKNTFEELLEMWGDYGKYNSSRNHMEESWKIEAGII